MALALQGAHAQGVIDALEGFGLTVGDASGKGLTPPYAVVYDISDSTSGTLGAPDDFSEFVFQVTCVGRLPSEARYVRDKAIYLVEGFAVPNRAIIRVSKEPGSGRVERDDEVTPPLYYCTPLFRVRSVPA